MGIYKYETKKGARWRVVDSYKDRLGNVVKIHQRGFETKKEAKKWLDDYITEMNAYCGSATDALNLTLNEFYEKIYLVKRQDDIREHTVSTKNNIFYKKISPYLGKLRIREIKKGQIEAWQNELKALRKPDGTEYSSQYLRTINNQLIAIFNFVQDEFKYSTPYNKKLRSFGSKENAKAVKIWTCEEYERFMLEIDDDLYYIAFQILFWGGLRVGELLALYYRDFDFNNFTLNITKSYQRLKGKDIISPPKTRKSVRTVGFLESDMQEFKEVFKRIYHLQTDSRVFESITKAKLRRKLNNYAKRAGLEPITIHGFRHSHVSFLINEGYTTFQIADRVGHSDGEITEIYSHLYPETKDAMLDAIARTRNIERSA